MTIRAIETNYAGCHFRSRLEARWAVVFNRIGVEWQYEPDGYEDDFGRRYLPDFYLPAPFDTFVEVKGADPDQKYMNKLEYFVDFWLPPTQWGTDSRTTGSSLLLLGPVPDPRHSWEHVLLHNHKGTLSSWVTFDDLWRYATTTSKRTPKQALSEFGRVCRRKEWTFSARITRERRGIVEGTGAFESARSARFGT